MQDGADAIIATYVCAVIGRKYQGLDTLIRKKCLQIPRDNQKP